MLEELQADGEPLGSLDFNKLVPNPMPEKLNIECGSRTYDGLRSYTAYKESRMSQAEADMLKEKDPGTWYLGRAAYENIIQFGYPTWYEWCIQHWGTTCNAYGFEPLADDASTMTFCTAWSAVPRIVKLISERHPNETVRYRWADENIGSNVGDLTFRNGEIVAAYIPEDGSPEAFELAGEVMDIDLSEFDLPITDDKRPGQCAEPRKKPPKDTDRRNEQKKERQREDR